MTMATLFRKYIAARISSATDRGFLVSIMSEAADKALVVVVVLAAVENAPRGEATFGSLGGMPMAVPRKAAHILNRTKVKHPGLEARFGSTRLSTCRV